MEFAILFALKYVHAQHRVVLGDAAAYRDTGELVYDRHFVDGWRCCSIFPSHQFIEPIIKSLSSIPLILGKLIVEACIELFIALGIGKLTFSPFPGAIPNVAFGVGESFKKLGGSLSCQVAGSVQLLDLNEIIIEEAKVFAFQLHQFDMLKNLPG